MTDETESDVGNPSALAADGMPPVLEFEPKSTRPVWANAAAAVMFGASVPELLDRSISALVVEPSNDILAAILSGTLAAEEQAPWHVLRPDGAVVIARVETQLRPEAIGAGIRVQLHDITAQARAEALHQGTLHALAAREQSEAWRRLLWAATALLDGGDATFLPLNASGVPETGEAISITTNGDGAVEDAVSAAVRHEGQVYGALIVTGRGRRRFTAEDSHLTAALASAAAVIMAAAQREQSRGAGRVLVTMQDQLNNQLALTVGYAELLASDVRLPLELQPLALEARLGAEEAAQSLRRLAQEFTATQQE